MDTCYVCLLPETSENLFCSKKLCDCSRRQKIHIHCLLMTAKHAYESNLDDILKCGICKSRYIDDYFYTITLDKKGLVHVEDKILDIEYIVGFEEAKWISYFPNGNVSSVIYYKRPSGLPIVRPNQEIEYVKKNRFGICEDFYISGKTKTRCTFHDGKRNGLLEIFDEKSKIMCSEFYIDDKRHGQRVIYKDGVITEISHYVDSWLHGITTRYNCTGDLHEIINYKCGKLDGIRTTYFKSPVDIENVEDFDFAMRFKKISMYKEGLLHGDTYIYEKDMIINIIPYVYGVKNGECKTFENGKLIRVNMYEHGMIKEVNEFNNGKVYKKYDVIPTEDGHAMEGRYQMWNEDDVLVSRGLIIDGIYHCMLSY